MYELRKVGENTYFINCPSRMGVYLEGGTDAFLIDSGNDGDAGKKALRILTENGWTLKAVLHTHTHADHAGGDALLRNRCGCPVYAEGCEKLYLQYPVMEPSYLFGGCPCAELRNKFLMAPQCECGELTEIELPMGLERIPLPGHSYAMNGFRTPDGVVFLGDSVTGQNILDKYHVTFLYDVAAYLQSLDRVDRLEGRLFIPSHAEPAEDIRPLVEANRKQVYEVIGCMLEICRTPRCFEDVLKLVFDRYGLRMDFTQYALVGSTVRSYLSYLHDEKRLSVRFEENRLLWETADSNHCRIDGMENENDRHDIGNFPETAG